MQDGDQGYDEPTRVARPERQRERRPGLRAVGLAASRVAAPIIVKRGGGFLVRLKAEWPAIVGAEWAEATWPAALGRDGALKLRVAGPSALAIQHRAPLLLQRVNQFFGRDIATRLVLVQGPLPLAPTQRPSAPRPLAAAEEFALEARLAAVSDPELRQALARLGRAVIGNDG